MRIQSFMTYQPNFKAHSYELGHKSESIVIKTDNEKKLGDKPCLVYQWRDNEEQTTMRKRGDIYSAEIGICGPDLSYYILYKDTGKIDLKDGEEYKIHPQKMRRKVAHDSRMSHGLPPVFTLKEGKTVGKLLYNSDGYSNFGEISDVKEPTILVTPNFLTISEIPNIVGIIFTNYDGGAFSHLSARLRKQTDVCACVFEEDIVEKLISMDGKNIELEVKDNNINFSETTETGVPIAYPEIKVPKLKPCNKILTSKEYSPDIIGAKAVNLRRLEELKEQGKIDVIIPKSIALPHGYIQDMYDENPLQEKYFNENRAAYTCKEDAYLPYNEIYCKDRIESLKQELFNNGIIENEKDSIMVRSAFNGEDLPNYSAAGLYYSDAASVADNSDLYKCIANVGQSKWDPFAVFSRNMHKIPEENIQPGVILQERINPDYKFTLYTDDQKGNLKIDLYSNKKWGYEGLNNPHTFTYNKETGELTYDSIQLENPIGKFNENQELISIAPDKNDLSGNTKLFEQIKKTAQNAVIVEDEFGAPQDIEGGIKGNDIYFWQTRNIVF